MKKNFGCFLLSCLFIGCLYVSTTDFLFPGKAFADDNSAGGSPVKIGYFIVPPHIFINRETKELTGALYDLIEEYIIPETGINFQWNTEPTSIPRQLATLKSSKRTASALLIFKPSRLKFSIFSAEPFFLTPPVIAFLKSNPIAKIETAEDLKNQVIGYAQDTYLTPFMRHPSIQFDLIPNPDYHGINLKKATLGRIDGVYIPGKGTMLFMLKRLELTGEFKIIDLPEKKAPYHMVFSKDLKTTAEKFDGAMEKLGGRSLYKQLLVRYIDISRL